MQRGKLRDVWPALVMAHITSCLAGGREVLALAQSAWKTVSAITSILHTRMIVACSSLIAPTAGHALTRLVMVIAFIIFRLTNTHPPV